MHDEPEPWASAAATDGLTETDLAQWRQHIAACPSCRRLNDEEFAMRDLLKGSLGPESPDSGFEMRILLRLRRGPLREKRPWYDFLQWRPFPYLAGALCLLIATAVVLRLQGHRMTPAPDPLASLPASVRDAIHSHARGGAISRIEPDDDNGDVSYAVTVTGAPGGPSHFTVGDDGSLLCIDRALGEVPGVVRLAINSQAGRNHVEEIQEDFEDSQPAFIATLVSPDGRERDYTFAQDGSLTEVETSLDELPPAVKASIMASVGRGAVEGVEKNFDNGEVSYVVTMSGTDALLRDYTFDEKGTLASVETFSSELPAPVEAIVKSQVGKGRLDGIDKSFEDGGITYQASTTMPDGTERDFSVSPSGELTSREVTWKETPKAVQQTISQTLGNGKLVEVSKAYDEPGGKVPYEIEASINGRPLYFLVSQSGSFLGIED
jgi:hypothetical protein